MKVPFSQRTGGPRAWIEDDWPETARMGLLNVLHDLVEKGYVDGWSSLDKELRRIARQSYAHYDPNKAESASIAYRSAEAILATLQWPRVFDFCERLYSHIACSRTEWDGYANHEVEVVSREEAQRFIGAELQLLFLEENLAYSFADGEVRRRGRNHTRDLMAKAEPTMGDPRLKEARGHYAKALRYFEHPSNPDFENAVKEAVCAVEAAARRLFPQARGKTLGEIIKQIQGADKGKLPKPLATTITGLYAYRNSGDGVSHGGSDGGQATQAVAEYVLGVAAAQVILLHEVACAAEIQIPF